MRKQHPATNVAPFRPRPYQLLATIRSLAKRSENVGWSEHALERMDERSITTDDALRVLQVGEIFGEITAGQNPGEWKCKVVERRKRARDIGVATIVVRERRLFVKTVEWEDP